MLTPNSPAELVLRAKPKVTKALLYAATFFEVSHRHGSSLATYLRELHFGIEYQRKQKD